MAGASPDEPGKMQRATRATRGARVGKQGGVVGKAGTHKPQKLVIKKQVDEKSPMPLKYRCLRAAEEYRQRLLARESALKRRSELEGKHREAYRNDMLALMRKQKKSKGGGLSRDNTLALSGPLPAPQGTPGAQKRHTEKPVQATKRSPEKAPPQMQPVVAQDRPEQPPSQAPQRMIPVEAQGRILQLDIAAYNTIEDVVNAVKALHRSVVWSQSPLLTYSRDAKAFSEILLTSKTPFWHFYDTATSIQCKRT